MRILRWGYDKFDTGYRIFTFFYSRKLGIDCYLFHYKKGSFIPKHKDPSKYGDMYRFNIELLKPSKGGQFHCRKSIWSFKNRIFLFNASQNYHYVTPIEEGSRWVLSFGWTKKN